MLKPCLNIPNATKIQVRVSPPGLNTFKQTKLEKKMPNFIRQNFYVLVLFLAMTAFSYIATVGHAQTKTVKTTTKTSPTPTKKTSPTPKKTNQTTAKATPKPTPKTTAKATVKPTPKPTPKTTAKTTPTPAKPKPTPTKSPVVVKKTTPKQPTEEQIKQSLPQIIAIVASARVREDHSLNARELTRLKLGTVVRALEKISQKSADGTKEEVWYKILLPDAKNRPTNSAGWISGTVVTSFTPDKSEEIYQKLAADRLKLEKTDFSDAVELYEFLYRIEPTIKTPKTAAEISLNRLAALKTALKEIPIDKMDEEPYKPFTKAQEKFIVYSEPAGQWFVRSDQFWALQKKYARLPLAEEIAWMAAGNPLPGECEGYVPCYIYLLRVTQAEYLRLYPKGKYSAEALKNISDYFSPIIADIPEKAIYTGPADVSDRADFNKNLVEIRVIVSKLAFLEKDAVMKQIDQLSDGFK
jgi:outer membrane biosynthesis protein TonB